MKFNELVKLLLKEDRYAPFDTKRRVKAPNAQNYGQQNPIFNKNQNVAAHSGFMGDRLNPKMNTAIFPMPKIRKRVKKRS